jgi:hypothetical protein
MTDVLLTWIQFEHEKLSVSIEYSNKCKFIELAKSVHFVLANFRGQPPYPILKDLSTDELEYITRWLDHYHVGPDPTNPRQIVGFLKEFKDQQDSGTSTFKLPEVPQ